MISPHRQAVITADARKAREAEVIRLRCEGRFVASALWMASSCRKTGAREPGDIQGGRGGAETPTPPSHQQTNEV